MQQPAHAKQRAALLSIGASLLLTLGKLTAGVLSGSLALMSEAGHNLADTGLTILTYFAVRLSDKPADEEHHYGHGKVEALAALVETGILFALSAYILVEAVRRLTIETVAIDANALAFGVLIISISVDLIRYATLSNVARKTKSDALAADAMHFASDIVGSLLTLLGLVATRLGYPRGDAVAAFGVALFIAIAGYRLAHRTVDTLLDTAPKGLAASVRAIARGVPGVIGVASLRLRPTGSTVVGDIGISIPRTLDLEKAATIEANVGAAIAGVHPDVKITVSANPVALDDETVLERVLLVAAKRHVPIHNVIVQQVDGRSSVSFDVEVDGHMPLGYAHDIVSGLEFDTRNELGANIEVETHIEPLEPRELPGRNAPQELRAGITAALTRHAVMPVTGIHSVRVRETPAGLVVNYHCYAAPDLSVDEVHHAVDAIERAVIADFPMIARLIGHAEPSSARDDRVTGKD
ncbi:MAG: cation diffusion facilitator family transporter [Beijerinckiaceae bacterium]